MAGTVLSIFLGFALWSWSFAVAAIGVFPMFISESVAHGVHRLWAKGCCFLIGLKIEIENPEGLISKEAKIIVPNHSSSFDIFILASLPIEFKWISKWQVGVLPFIGWAMRAMGCYFVRRNKSGRDLNVMRDVEAGLKSGRSIVIFPEGTRSRTNELLPFKKGAFRLAKNTGVPILPVAILGSFEIAPPRKLPRRFGHRVRLRVGDPIYVAPEGDILRAMTDTREALICLKKGENPE